jgi:hypothetical protein
MIDVARSCRRACGVPLTPILRPHSTLLRDSTPKKVPELEGLLSEQAPCAYVWDDLLKRPAGHSSVAQSIFNRQVRGTRCFAAAERAGCPQGSHFVFILACSTNVLMGVGILSLPYALRLSGWAGIGLLLLLAVRPPPSFANLRRISSERTCRACAKVITSYTAMLLGKMLNYMPGMTSYPDVGQVAPPLVAALPLRPTACSPVR